MTLEFSGPLPWRRYFVRLRPALESVAAGIDRLGPGRIEVSVLTPGRMRSLSGRYFGTEYDTDVISFGYQPAGYPDDLSGEILLSGREMFRQAAVYGETAEQTFVLMVMHGLLHITGMEDATSAGRSRMNLRQAALAGRVMSAGPDI